MPERKIYMNISDAVGDGISVRETFSVSTSLALAQQALVSRNRQPPAMRSIKISPEETHMNSIIYLVGLVVIVLFILSFLGLR